MSTVAVAAALLEIADLLELQAANTHRVHAYRTAAQQVRGMPAEFIAQVARGDATPRRGIGRGMLDKIGDLARTGTCPRLRELQRAVPVASRRLLAVPGLGPMRIRRLTEALTLRTLCDVEAACRRRQVRTIAGFGPRMEDNILEALSKGRTKTTRFSRAAVVEEVARLTRYMRQVPSLRVIMAGSYRRQQATVGDLDVLVTGRAMARAVEHFAAYASFERVTSRGLVRATAYLKGGLQVDLRAVPIRSLGAALLYFTGSKTHNVEVRRIARTLGLHLNEYGLFRGTRRVAGETEAGIYKGLGLAWIPPERREGIEGIRPRESARRSRSLKPPSP